jgi:hypothetical protein
LPPGARAWAKDCLFICIDTYQDLVFPVFEIFENCILSYVYHDLNYSMNTYIYHEYSWEFSSYVEFLATEKIMVVYRDNFCKNFFI